MNEYQHSPRNTMWIFRKCERKCMTSWSCHLGFFSLIIRFLPVRMNSPMSLFFMSFYRSSSDSFFSFPHPKRSQS